MSKYWCSLICKSSVDMLNGFFRVNQCIQYKMHPSNIIAYIKIMGLLHWNNMACIRFHWANISIFKPNQRIYIYLTAFISNECWNLSFEHGNLCARGLQFIRFLLTLRMHFHAAYFGGDIVQKIQFFLNSNGNFIENRWHLDRILAAIIQVSKDLCTKFNGNLNRKTQSATVLGSMSINRCSYVMLSHKISSNGVCLLFSQRTFEFI